MEIVPVASRLKDVVIAMIGCSAYQATRTNNSTIYTKIFFNSYDLRLGTTVEGCVCNVWITTPKMCQEGLCAVKNGCEECSQRTYCVWCEEKGTNGRIVEPNTCSANTLWIGLCLPGGLFGPTDGSQCGEWTWYHCGGGTVPLIVLISSYWPSDLVVSGTIVLVILGLSLLGLVIVITGTVLIVKRVKARNQPRTMFLPSSRRRDTKPLLANTNNINNSSNEDIKPKSARRLPSPIMEEGTLNIIRWKWLTSERAAYRGRRIAVEFSSRTKQTFQ